MKKTDKDNVMGREGRMTHSDAEWEEELNGSEVCQNYS